MSIIFILHIYKLLNVQKIGDHIINQHSYVPYTFVIYQITKRYRSIWVYILIFD